MTTARPGDALGAALVARLPGRVERDVPVAALTTYRLGGPVAWLVRVGSVDELLALASVVRDQHPAVLVVGRGSNLLVADGGFAGVGVVLAGELDRVDARPDEHEVRAGGAAALPVMARRAAAAGLAGLEFYVGIPGSVGGAVRMNAGGHGRTTAEVLRHARVVDLDAARVRSVGVDELGLGYRSSTLGPLDVVVEAAFAVRAADPGECDAALGEVVAWRRDHQPGGANAGSVFANPPGDSAGRIIDALGLKGFRVGGAVVSPKHANFFQAEPGATADDVYRLVAEVRRRVRDATGVELEPELRMVGFGDDAAPAAAPRAGSAAVHRTEGGAA